MSAEEKDKFVADRVVERLRNTLAASNLVDKDIIKSNEEAVQISSVALSIVSRLIEEAHDGIVRVSSYERAWYDNLSMDARIILREAATNILCASYSSEL